MSVPAQRRTSSCRKRRASHHALKETSARTCPKCKNIIQPHRACPKCGTYKDRVVLDVQKKIKRLAKK
ncbi:MAG: 50S ribosomal protein L32 [bacterium]